MNVIRSLELPIGGPFSTSMACRFPAMEVTYRTPARSTGAERTELPMRMCQRTWSGALAARIPCPPVRGLSRAAWASRFQLLRARWSWAVLALSRFSRGRFDRDRCASARPRQGPTCQRTQYAPAGDRTDSFGWIVIKLHGRCW